MSKRIISPDKVAASIEPFGGKPNLMLDHKEWDYCATVDLTPAFARRLAKMLTRWADENDSGSRED